MTRPSLPDYVATTDALDACAARVFEAISTGAIAPRIGQRFALADVAEAHRALENRDTFGATVLRP
jgi:NADPH2:quinone reductase